MRLGFQAGPRRALCHGEWRERFDAADDDDEAESDGKAEEDAEGDGEGEGEEEEVEAELESHGVVADLPHAVRTAAGAAAGPATGCRCSASCSSSLCTSSMLDAAGLAMNTKEDKVGMTPRTRSKCRKTRPFPSWVRAQQGRGGAMSFDSLSWHPYHPTHPSSSIFPALSTPSIA